MSLLLRCAGCGEELDLVRQLPFRCPVARAGDDVDHVLAIHQRATPDAWPVSLDPNPFQRFAAFGAARALADTSGLSRESFAEEVAALDAAVEAIDGRGFRTTPYALHEGLGAWVKDETGNVAGSHKARHLMGVALYLRVASRVPPLAEQLNGAPLAVASCGNAALAAATLAAAMGRELDVYVPDWAEEPVLDRLRALGARLHVCERKAGDPPGDPCYHAFVAAVEGGAIPFTCQGDRNGLAIDGGRTLAWELAEQHASTGEAPMERLFVQVGGGALASSAFQGLWMARDAGVIPTLPALHAVQVEAAAPLARAWRLLARELAGSEDPDHELAARLRAERTDEELFAAVAAAARKRSAYMQPVAEPPRSLASGILDDETYDGFAVIAGMLLTGGWPVVVEEQLVARAHDLARKSTGIAVCPTGSAGLAGLLAEREEGRVAEEEPVGLLFTGAER